MKIVHIQEWLYIHKPVKRIAYLGGLFVLTFLITLGLTPKTEDTKSYTILLPYYEEFHKIEIASTFVREENLIEKKKPSLFLQNKNMTDNTHAKGMYWNIQQNALSSTIFKI